MKPILVFLMIVFCATGGYAASGQPLSWDGTWVGNWSGKNGAQIIFAGNDVIGLYWRGDYVSEVRSQVLEAGKVVKLTWASASATLTRDTETKAHIVIRKPGKPDSSFSLKRDA